MSEFLRAVPAHTLPFLIAQIYANTLPGLKGRAQRPLAASDDQPIHRFDCLILDDLGYASNDQAETSALVELIAERYERRSLVVTCIQPFSEWDKIFPNPAMTVAAIDRLVHHATILKFNAESYRRRTAAKQAELAA